MKPGALLGIWSSAFLLTLLHEIYFKASKKCLEASAGSFSAAYRSIRDLLCNDCMALCFSYQSGIRPLRNRPLTQFAVLQIG